MVSVFLQARLETFLGCEKELRNTQISRDNKDGRFFLSARGKYRFLALAAGISWPEWTKRCSFFFKYCFPIHMGCFGQFLCFSDFQFVNSTSRKIGASTPINRGTPTNKAGTSYNDSSRLQAHDSDLFWSGCLPFLRIDFSEDRVCQIKNANVPSWAFKRLTLWRPIVPERFYPSKTNHRMPKDKERLLSLTQWYLITLSMRVHPVCSVLLESCFLLSEKRPSSDRPLMHWISLDGKSAFTLIETLSRCVVKGK